MASLPDYFDIGSDASDPVSDNMRRRNRRSSGASEDFLFACRECNTPTDPNWLGVDARTELCRNCAINVADKYEFVEQSPLRRYRQQVAQTEPAAMEADKSPSSELEKSEVNDGTPEPGIRDENEPSVASYNPDRIRRYSDESDTSVIVVTVLGSVTADNPAGTPMSAPTIRKKIGAEISTDEATKTTITTQEMDKGPELQLVGRTEVEPAQDPVPTDDSKDTTDSETVPSDSSTDDPIQTSTDPEDPGDTSVTTKHATKQRSLKDEARHRIEQKMGVEFLSKLKHAEDAGYHLWKKIRQLVLLPQATKLGSDKIIKALVKAQHSLQLSRKPSMFQPSGSRLTATAVEHAIEWVRQGDGGFLTYKVDTGSLAAKGWGVDAFGCIVEPGSTLDETTSHRIPESRNSDAHVVAAKTPIANKQRSGVGTTNRKNAHMLPSVTLDNLPTSVSGPLLPKGTPVPAPSSAMKTPEHFIPAPPAPPAPFVQPPSMRSGSQVYGPQSTGLAMVPSQTQRLVRPKDHSQELVRARAVQGEPGEVITPPPEAHQVEVMSHLQDLHRFHEQMVSQRQVGANIVQGVLKIVDRVTKDKEAESAKSAKLRDEVAGLRKANESLEKRTRELECDVDRQSKKLKVWEDKKKLLHDKKERLDEAFRIFSE